MPARKRLMICSVVVAVVGLLGALLIYLTAGEDRERDENVQMIIADGKIYRIPLENTKMYRRDLQRFGGNAAVLFDDLHRWFTGLWRGRSLAITVAWITAGVSLGLFLFARQILYDPSSDDRADDHEAG